MANLVLTQEEADTLIAMKKSRIDDRKWDYPGLGGSICIQLTSLDKREKFILDVSRSGRIALKGKYQNRARQSVILVRYDFGVGPHRNPDDSEIDCPHIHIYREGFGDKWAYPIPEDVFTDLADPWQALTDFMRYCNIIEPPNIEKVLFK